MPTELPEGAEKPFSSVLLSMPRALYRYAGVAGDRLEWIRKLLIESQLYFTSPQTFNDPLDCRSVILEFTASSLKAEQYWRNVARNAHPNEPVRLYKRRIRELVAKPRTSAGRERLRKTFLETVAKQGVVCMSTQPANMLMWSHYAEGHKGIALRFNMDLRLLATLLARWMPVPVQYTTQYPHVNFFELRENPDLLMPILGTKPKAWEHEQEWRLVLLDQTGYVSIPPRMIDGVIFGLRTELACEEQIRKWVAERSVPTDLLRVKHESDSFELKVVPA